MSEYIYTSNGEPLANDSGSVFLARTEIVRCRDCKYLWTTCGKHYCDLCYEVKVILDDFCSKGERKEND